MQPLTDYVLTVDLSGVDFSGTKGVTAAPPSRAFQELVARSEQRETIDLQVLLVADERMFEPDPATRFQTLTVDLAKLRAYRRPNLISTEEAKQVVESRTASFGRIAFRFRTKEKPGTGSMALSFWTRGSLPVDEVSVPFCIAPEVPGATDCPPQGSPSFSLSGHDSVRVAASGDSSNGLPDGALQFIELDEDTVVGVFRCNTCGWPAEQFFAWRLKRSVAGLKSYLRETVLHDLELSEAERSWRTHGVDLFYLLFGSPNSADERAAQTAFQGFIRGRRSGLATDLEDIPSLFVRLLTKRAEEFQMLPVGILTLPKAEGQPEEIPIGLQLRVETPLLYQDYTPTETCISHWSGLVPDPNLFTNENEMHQVGKPLHEWVARLGSTPNASFFREVPAFRDWLRDSGAARAAPSLAILVASHHEANRLYFKTEETIQSVSVQRPFPRPSIVLLNACGTGKPGASDFVNVFNSRGASAIVATSTAVNAKMAGRFISTLLQTLSDHPKWTIGRAFFAATTTLSREEKSPGEAYGARILTYVLLGNGGLRLCVGTSNQDVPH